MLVLLLLRSETKYSMKLNIAIVVLQFLVVGLVNTTTNTISIVPQSLRVLLAEIVNDPKKVVFIIVSYINSIKFNFK